MSKDVKLPKHWGSMRKRKGAVDTVSLREIFDPFRVFDSPPPKPKTITRAMLRAKAKEKGIDVYFNYDRDRYAHKWNIRLALCRRGRTVATLTGPWKKAYRRAWAILQSEPEKK